MIMGEITIKTYEPDKPDTGVSTVDELDRRLDQLSAESRDCPIIVDLINAEGDCLTMGLGAGSRRSTRSRRGSDGVDRRRGFRSRGTHGVLLRWAMDGGFETELRARCPRTSRGSAVVP